MPLVDYSDSDASDTPVPSSSLGRNNHKRKREEIIPSSLPPLPDSFHDLYASAVRTSTQDDPSLHGGRKRQTPHVEGKWPTHVYLEWYPAKKESNQITQILAHLQNDALPEQQRVHSLLENDLGVQLPLHISLSRSIALTTDQRAPFVETLRKMVVDSRVAPFTLSTNGLRWVPNYEGNRWFLVLQVEKPGNDGLNRLLQISNAVAEGFGQPPLYAKPRESSVAGRSRNKRKGIVHDEAFPDVEAGISLSTACEDKSSCFHVSVGWSLEQPTSVTQQELERLMDEYPNVVINVDVVKTKLGNAVTSLPLAAKQEISRGFI